MAIQWNSQAFEGRVQEAIDRGLYEAAEVLLAQAINAAPWEEKHLRNSGEAHAGEGVATVSFNTPYAVTQHENLDFQHPRGGGPKFLERPANAFGDEMRAIVGTHVQGVLG